MHGAVLNFWCNSFRHRNFGLSQGKLQEGHLFVSTFIPDSVQSTAIAVYPIDQQPPESRVRLMFDTLQ